MFRSDGLSFEITVLLLGRMVFSGKVRRGGGGFRLSKGAGLPIVQVELPIVPIVPVVKPSIELPKV